MRRVTGGRDVRRDGDEAVLADAVVADAVDRPSRRCGRLPVEQEKLVLLGEGRRYPYYLREFRVARPKCEPAMGNDQGERASEPAAGARTARSPARLRAQVTEMFVLGGYRGGRVRQLERLLARLQGLSRRARG